MNYWNQRKKIRKISRNFYFQKKFGFYIENWHWEDDRAGIGDTPLTWEKYGSITYINNRMSKCVPISILHTFWQKFEWNLEVFLQIWMMLVRKSVKMCANVCYVFFSFFLHGILVLRANDQNRPSIIEGADIFWKLNWKGIQFSNFLSILETYQLYELTIMCLHSLSVI